MLGVCDARASDKWRLTTTIPVEIVIDRILTKAVILMKRSQQKEFEKQDPNIQKKGVIYIKGGHLLMEFNYIE